MGRKQQMRLRGLAQHGARRVTRSGSWHHTTAAVDSGCEASAASAGNPNLDQQLPVRSKRK